MTGTSHAGIGEGNVKTCRDIPVLLPNKSHAGSGEGATKAATAPSYPGKSMFTQAIAIERRTTRAHDTYHTSAWAYPTLRIIFTPRQKRC